MYCILQLKDAERRFQVIEQKRTVLLEEVTARRAKTDYLTLKEEVTCGWQTVVGKRKSEMRICTNETDVVTTMSAAPAWSFSFLPRRERLPRFVPLGLNSPKLFSPTPLKSAPPSPFS